MEIQPLTEQEQADQALDLYQMERDWQAQLPRLSEAQWLNIFPEAKKRWGRLIKGLLKIENKYIPLIKNELKRRTIQSLRDNPRESEWRDSLIRENFEQSEKKLTRRFSRNRALLELIEQIGKQTTSKTSRITEAMVQRAREYPLEQLIEINRAGFTKCFNHNDKTPSAYCKNNFMYCFAENKSWDTIQILIDRDKLSFGEAVLKLQ